MELVCASLFLLCKKKRRRGINGQTFSQNPPKQGKRHHFKKTKKKQKKACIRPFNDGGYVCHGVFQLCTQELCWTTVEFSFVFQSRQLLRPRVTIKLCTVPANSPLRGGDVAVYVFDINQPSLPTPFYSALVSISVFMAL